MDAIEAILRRRSVRDSFGTEPVSAEILETVLRCGQAAPSSKNARPWRFHPVTDRQLLGELADAVERAEGKELYVPHDPTTGAPWTEWRSSVSELAKVLRAAPAAIFIENLCRFSRGRETLMRASPAALSLSIMGYGLELLGIGAAIQNMWIAATACGLRGVFMGDILIAQREIKERLHIEFDLTGVLVLGHGETAPENRTEA